MDAQLSMSILSVFSLYFTLLSIVVLSLFIFREIYRKFSHINRTTWIFLIILSITSLFIRISFISHRPLVTLNDLDINAANWFIKIGLIQNCFYTSRDSYSCVAMPRSHGFPFVIGLLFFVFGVNLDTPFILNIIFGTLSVVLIFLLTYLLFKNEIIGLYASFLLVISPIHILYSISAQSITISLFFVLSSLTLYLLYSQIKKDKIFLLFSFLLVFTMRLRYETLILLPLFWY